MKKNKHTEIAEMLPQLATNLNNKETEYFQCASINQSRSRCNTKHAWEIEKDTKQNVRYIRYDGREKKPRKKSNLVHIHLSDIQRDPNKFRYILVTLQYLNTHPLKYRSFENTAYIHTDTDTHTHTCARSNPFRFRFHIYTFCYVSKTWSQMHTTESNNAKTANTKADERIDHRDNRVMYVKYIMQLTVTKLIFASTMRWFCYTHTI